MSGDTSIPESVFQDCVSIVRRVTKINPEHINDLDRLSRAGRGWPC